jgi:type I restriction enzyme, S subunit
LDGRIESPSQGRVPGDHREAVGSKISRPGDIVLTVKGTVGRVALIPPEAPVFAYSPQLCYFRPVANGPLRSLYLYYWFKSAEFWNQADALKGQTDMADYLSLSDIEALKIRIPSLDLQDGIVGILGSLDDKIAVNDRMATTGESLVLAIASDERWTKMVPLGEIVACIRSQVDPKGLTAEAVAHYSLPSFDAGRLPEIVPPNTIKSGKFLVDGPAVLLSKLNPATPRVWNVNPGPEVPALASTEFMVLKPVEDVTPHEVWAVSMQPAFIGDLIGMATGTSNSHQRVRPNDLLAAHVVDPRSIPTSDREIIASVSERSREARYETRSLAELRDTLLPKLMSGEIRVRDAEKVVGDVVLWRAGCRRRSGKTSSWSGSRSLGGSPRTARTLPRGPVSVNPGMS